MTTEAIHAKVESLALSPAARKGLQDFATQVVDIYKDDLTMVAAFGSVVTGDYDEGESDINLLVVYAELEIADLERVADLSRRWLRKQKLAPRFLSRRNLEQSEPYFQVDLLDMRDAHVVLCGEDILSGIKLRPAELRWQIAHEIKAMRMRMKQMYWRAASDSGAMRSVLVGRFTSLLHLIRALLLLRGLPAPLTRQQIVGAAAEHLGLDRQAAGQLLELRKDKTASDRKKLAQQFGQLMEMIRLVDTSVEDYKV
jgi:predicted nucleotidyltransferase